VTLRRKGIMSFHFQVLKMLEVWEAWDLGTRI